MICRLLTAAVCGLLVFSAPAWADKIVSIEAEGLLVTEAGEKLKMAGIDPAPEAVSLLSVLLSGKDAELRKTGSGDAAYVFVNASELPMPFPQGSSAEEKKILINELLIRLGAARVLEEENFDRREDFLKVQEEARLRGEGIWSYETPAAGV